LIGGVPRRRIARRATLREDLFSQIAVRHVENVPRAPTYL
jgi:hypothetical protein